MDKTVEEIFQEEYDKVQELIEQLRFVHLIPDSVDKIRNVPVKVLKDMLLGLCIYRRSLCDIGKCEGFDLEKKNDQG